MAILTPESLSGSQTFPKQKPRTSAKRKATKGFISAKEYQDKLKSFKSMVTSQVCFFNGIRKSDIKMTTDITGSERIDNSGGDFTSKSKLNYRTPMPVTSTQFNRRFISLLLLYMVEYIDELVPNMTQSERGDNKNYRREYDTLTNIIRVVKRLSYDFATKAYHGKSMRVLMKVPIYVKDGGINHKKYNRRVGAIMRELDEGTKKGMIINSQIPDDVAVDSLIKLGAMLVSLKNDIAKYVPSFKQLEGLKLDKYDISQVIGEFGCGINDILTERNVENFVYRSFILANPAIKTNLPQNEEGIKEAVLTLGFISFIMDEPGVDNLIKRIVMG